MIGAALPWKNDDPISTTAFGLMNKEIERVDSSFRSMFSVQASLVTWPIFQYGTEVLKKRVLDKLISGEFVGCFGLTEPDHGSDPGAMATTATKDGDHWVLNGSKTWITSSPIADIFLIWAKDTASGKLMGFVAEKDFAGIEAPKIKGKMSLRSSVTGQIFLNDVRIPEDNVLTKRGFGAAFSCLNKARLGISWGVLGAAEDCFFRAREYQLNRKQFDCPLAGFQLPQKKFADMQTEITLGQLAVL